MCSLMAIVFGLNNVAVSRLESTWEVISMQASYYSFYMLLPFQRLPIKFRKTFEELDELTDPSRNHRSYRSALQEMTPPIIPFVPLLLKGFAIELPPIHLTKQPPRYNYIFKSQ